MGSSAYHDVLPPKEFKEIIDEALQRGDSVIVGEAHGACRAFQNYLYSKGTRNVVVGHAKTIRYNVGGWPTRKYGDTLPEREKALIEDCDYALVIWVNGSNVIKGNLDYLRRLHKPVFVYEVTSTEKGTFYALE